MHNSHYRNIILVLMLFISAMGHAQDFSISPIDDATFLRMRQGGSYPEGCSIPRDDLRYLRISHYDFDGNIQQGEMVCNKAIANDLIEIFRELYRNRYPIQRMRLIDDYGADDETSMRANNTSCFCYRTTSGSRKLSAHARGMAIDINPLQNPYVKTTKEGRLLRLQPTTSKAYIKRTPRKAHMIDRSDLCYRLFIKHGFQWGGAWRSVKDYQHFEK